MILAGLRAVLQMGNYVAYCYENRGKMKLEAQVAALYNGTRPGLEKAPCDQLEANLEGFVGDKHAGFTKRADVRNPEYKRGSLMRNDRQWSAVSPQELAEVAKVMRIPHLDPAWLGANLALAGIPNFTALPKGTKFIFPSGAVLVVEEENYPCVGPGRVIAAKYPELELKANRFPKMAMGKRGLIGVIERPGLIKLQDLVIVEVYTPKIYMLPAELKS